METSTRTQVTGPNEGTVFLVRGGARRCEAVRGDAPLRLPQIATSHSRHYICMIGEMTVKEREGTVEKVVDKLTGKGPAEKTGERIDDAAERLSHRGPMEKAGDRLKNAVDDLSGKGPAQKAGEKIDNTARELKKH